MRTILLIISTALVLSCTEKPPKEGVKPNILWIIAEDLSPFMGCYGDSINNGYTPTIDHLASEGVLFKRAYATAPVCSASRSALITGVMQTTTGTHQHRSSRTTDGEVVPEILRILLPEHIKTIPELMRQAGYFTFNNGKDDYNFHYNRNDLYALGQADDYVPGMNGWQGNRAKGFMSLNDAVWSSRPDKKQAWFGQVQIMGGKSDFKYVEERQKLAPDDVPLPPYFPDAPELREAWTRHYNANRGSDVLIAEILAKLKADGELENTIIFFFSDHGSNTSLRHKQFCYEGGLHVPLIIKGNHKAVKPGTIRNELVSLLDVSATTLALAGIELPEYLEGQNLFSDAYQPPQYMIGARDRCDYTIDRIRTVRSDTYRYIRNYYPERPMLQAGYRDDWPVVMAFKQLYADGKLNAYQAAHWFGTRPAEELYDLKADPHQMNNLAQESDFKNVLEEHRALLQNWMRETDDKGQYQESSTQLKATYELWKDRPIFKNAQVNPEYDRFR
ncbi:MAG: sulfatase [Flavobacteriaceae bacterium]